MNRKFIAGLGLLALTGIAQADCVQSPCTVPMMTVKTHPTPVAPIEAQCPAYVILNGQHIDFLELEAREEGTSKCIYADSDITIYISIDAK